MSNHTPGPWHISPSGDAVVDKARIIARCAQTHSFDLVTDPNGQANARLIAAAPEMLEALRDVEQYALTHKEFPVEIFALVSSALAKAGR